MNGVRWGLKCATIRNWKYCASMYLKSVSSFAVAELSHNVGTSYQTYKNAVPTSDNASGARKSNHEREIVSMSQEMQNRMRGRNKRRTD